MGKLKPRGAPDVAVRAGAYFLQPSRDLTFVPSGCALLDSVLGGGWVLGRMANIVGDKSTSKTGLAVEAMAQFAMAFPGLIKYRESEGAFDKGYAEMMGMPIDRVAFWEDDHPSTGFETIEDLFEDLNDVLSEVKKEPSLYIVDSLDGLSDREEMKRKIGEGSYSLEKQKKLGQLFRRLVRRIEQSRMCFLIVSQVRDNIGVQFGEKHKRTGGKSMDFYASQVLWLSHLKTLRLQRGGAERAVGIRVKANCKKNKVSLPFRQCDFEYRFGYGIDDLGASLEWLQEVGRLALVTGAFKRGEDKKMAAQFRAKLEKLPDEDYRQACHDVAVIVREAWADVDQAFLPTRKKYG